MPMMNGAGPPGGQGSMTGRQQGMQQAGGQQQELIAQLRQMDNEQLVQLVLQLRNALMEVQQRQTGGQAQGQQTQVPVR